MGRHALQELPVVATCQEADVLTLGLLGDGEAVASSDGPYVFFLQVAQGKGGPGELVLGQSVEEIGLILSWISAAQKSKLAVGGAYSGIMPRRQQASAQVPCLLHEDAEAYEAIADDAGVRRSTGGVFPDEVVHHLALEGVASIDEVERYVEVVCHGASSVYGLRRGDRGVVRVGSE